MALLTDSGRGLLIAFAISSSVMPSPLILTFTAKESQEKAITKQKTSILIIFSPQCIYLLFKSILSYVNKNHASNFNSKYFSSSLYSFEFQGKLIVLESPKAAGIIKVFRRRAN